MENEILCSTGTFIGRANGYDYRKIIETHREIRADGFELMMLKAWDGSLLRIAHELEAAGVRTPTLHIEKDVGAALFLGDEDEYRAGLCAMTESAEMARAIGAKKAIFHLWDGRFDEAHVRRAIDGLTPLYEIFDTRGVALLVENVPCRAPSPFDGATEIAARYPGASFIFDLRHGSFLGECDRFYESDLWQTRVSHLHISDHIGQTAPNMWGVTRPIVQPGEGIADIPALLSALARYHGGTVALESPALSADGVIHLDTLNRSMDFLYRTMKSVNNP